MTVCEGTVCWVGKRPAFRVEKNTEGQIKSIELVREALEALRTTQTVAVALGCPPGPGKTLLLKVSDTLVGDIKKSNWNWKLPPCWPS